MSHSMKNKKSKTGLSVWQYAQPYLPAILVALIAAAAGTILTILGPDKIKDITNYIAAGLPTLVNGETLMGSIDVSSILSIALVLAFFYAASALLSLLQNMIMTTVSQRFAQKLRNGISTKINRLPLKYFDRVTTGDVLSRVTNDVDTVGQALNQGLGTLVGAITMFVGSLIMMFITNWIMALAAIVSTVIGFALMLFIMGRSQKHFVAQQEDLGSINGHIEEVFSGHSVVKAFNANAGAKETFEDVNGRLYISGWKSQFISGMMQPVMGFIGNLGYVVVCVVGAVLTLNGTISFGVIVAFMLYIRLFTQTLSQIAQAATSLQSAVAASKRVTEFLSEDELQDESQKEPLLQNVQGNVVFDHVQFGYAEDRIVIHDFSAQVKAGQKVAIVGPTGAGKTTMINLLMRFYELDGGQIRIDGIPINNTTRQNVHEQFSMVLQDTWLFEGTIRENLVYCKENVSDEQVIQACKAVGVHSFITSLPGGYDTVLSDSANLSQGQRQLLTIARAMIQDAPMLILDEATSSIDTRTELMIQKAMDTLAEGKTSFVIAHRLSTIKNADLILVMKDGDIIESGSHHELLMRGGFYQNLYNSQFEQAS